MRAQSTACGLRGAVSTRAASLAVVDNKREPDNEVLLLNTAVQIALAQEQTRLIACLRRARQLRRQLKQLQQRQQRRQW